MRPLLAILAIAWSSGVTGAADLATATLTGEAHTPSAKRAAKLRLTCQPARGGAIELELEIPDAQHIADFDFEPFEGPDAPAASRTLSTIGVEGGGAPRVARYSAAGWYSGDDPTAFVFGVSQRSHRTGAVATQIGQVDEHTTRITWTQHGHGDRGKQTLEASFAVDAGAARHLHATVAPCLPRAATHQEPRS
jgi:hypothetical protein